MKCSPCCLLSLSLLKGSASFHTSSQRILPRKEASPRRHESSLFAEKASFLEVVIANKNSEKGTKSSMSTADLGDGKEIDAGLLFGQQEQTRTTIGKKNSMSAYQQGLLTIGFCTFVFSSLSPVNHAVLSNESGSLPVLGLNAVVSIVAFLSVTLAGPLLEKGQRKPMRKQTTIPEDAHNGLDKKVINDYTEKTAERNLKDSPVQTDAWQFNPAIGGAELGLWKFCGTLANLYGLSLTTADHGAFLIQLTTFIVPAVQGLLGVPISRRLQTSVVMALVGIGLFTQDGANTASSAGSLLDNSDMIQQGDALCVLAAVFYATYDLRLYQWGQRIAPRPLMVRKIGTQAFLSLSALVLIQGTDGIMETVNAIMQQTEGGDSMTSLTTLCLIAWSGIMVNCVVPFLQVSGQQAIGPTASQTIYSSQPLWAAVMSYFWFGEVVGTQGLVGGCAFLGALLLAASSSSSDDAKEKADASTVPESY